MQKTTENCIFIKKRKNGILVFIYMMIRVKAKPCVKKIEHFYMKTRKYS